MEERPILFSTPMAIATVEGRKDQTRRIVKDQGKLRDLTEPHAKNIQFEEHGIKCDWLGGKYAIPMKCPYGKPGDRLWGKESFYAWGRWETRFDAKLRRDAWHFVDMTLESGRAYLFDEPEGGKKWLRGGVTPQWWKRPAIFMPRVASRIYREIVSVRAERVQDISEKDAKAEGVMPKQRIADDHWFGWHSGEPLPPGYSYRDGFWSLWDLINAKRAPWKSNPFVWVIQYKPVEE